MFTGRRNGWFSTLQVYWKCRQACLSFYLPRSAWFQIDLKNQLANLDALFGVILCWLTLSKESGSPSSWPLHSESLMQWGAGRSSRSSCPRWLFIKWPRMAWGQAEGNWMTYHGLLCLDCFHLEAFFPLWGSVAEVLLLPKGSLSLPAGRPGLWMAAGIAWWGGPRMYVPTLLFGDMSLWAMHCLHVFPEGTRVCVALRAAWDFTHIRFLPKATRMK